MEIKTTMKLSLHTIRMSSLQTTVIISVVVEDTEDLITHTAGGKATGTATLENSLSFSVKLKMYVPYDPATALMLIYPRVRKNIYLMQKLGKDKCLCISKNWK